MDPVFDRPFESLAEAVAALTTPEFVELQGCVLRRSSQWTPTSLEVWVATGASVPAIEDTLNHVHLWDEFDVDADGEASEEALLGACDVIAAGWRTELRRRFPDREFDVSVTDDYGPTVTCFSVDATHTSSDGRGTRARKFGRLIPRLR